MTSYHRSTEEMNQLVQSTMAMILHTVKARNIECSSDMRVSETHAAELIGFAPGSLKNIRLRGEGPIYYRQPVGGSRISYRLMDIAAWIEARRELSDTTSRHR